MTRTYAASDKVSVALGLPPEKISRKMRAEVEGYLGGRKAQRGRGAKPRKFSCLKLKV